MRKVYLYEIRVRHRSLSKNGSQLSVYLRTAGKKGFGVIRRFDSGVEGFCQYDENSGGDIQTESFL